MLNLAAAAIFARELTEEHLEGATHGSGSPRAPRSSGALAGAPSGRPAHRARRRWILRVASLVTQRSTEETWPRRKSRTSAC
jgi:hypothetical protein